MDGNQFNATESAVPDENRIPSDSIFGFALNYYGLCKYCYSIKLRAAFLRDSRRPVLKLFHWLISVVIYARVYCRFSFSSSVTLTKTSPNSHLSKRRQMDVGMV